MLSKTLTTLSSSSKSTAKSAMQSLLLDTDSTGLQVRLPSRPLMVATALSTTTGTYSRRYTKPSRLQLATTTLGKRTVVPITSRLSTLSSAKMLTTGMALLLATMAISLTSPSPTPSATTTPPSSAPATSMTAQPIATAAPSAKSSDRLPRVATSSTTTPTRYVSAS